MNHTDDKELIEKRIGVVEAHHAFLMAQLELFTFLENAEYSQEECRQVTHHAALDDVEVLNAFHPENLKAEEWEEVQRLVKLNYSTYGKLYQLSNEISDSHFWSY